MSKVITPRALILQPTFDTNLLRKNQAMYVYTPSQLNSKAWYGTLRREIALSVLGARKHLAQAIVKFADDLRFSFQHAASKKTLWQRRRCKINSKTFLGSSPLCDGDFFLGRRTRFAMINFIFIIYYWLIFENIILTHHHNKTTTTF